ncbi:S-layer homology domain-containing protein [Aneurinibacillus migulanus]|uniref:S-layer homology domain-containing protein n=1 Tax=Aneurinibacillus migulanus TaxID=47500 RepID=UPI00399D2C7E
MCKNSPSIWFYNRTGGLFFCEVDSFNGAKADVSLAVKTGLISGYPDGRFQPNREFKAELQWMFLYLSDRQAIQICL